MPVIVYLDETGDHNLKAEDKDFPVFVLILLICDINTYCREIVPTVYRLKMDQWGHEGIILHSRDIRKAQGDFSFLTTAALREPFYERINQVMGRSDYTLIASVIQKQSHREKYGVRANNPYDLSLTFALERLLPLLESRGQVKVTLVAESRGKKEDNELKLTLMNIVNSGTDYVDSGRFRKIIFDLVFKSKAMNIVGTQMADLAGYPIARHVLDPSKPNPAYAVIKSKFYRGPGWVSGLKIFP